MEIQAQEERKSLYPAFFPRAPFRPSEVSPPPSQWIGIRGIHWTRENGRSLSTAPRKPTALIAARPLSHRHLPFALISDSAVDRSFNHHAVWRAICFISSLEMLT